MSFFLPKVDEDALAQVEIAIAGPEGDERTVGTDPSTSGVKLVGNVNVQFPPKITKDGKDADWMEVASGSFEPMKFYIQSQPRKLGLEFQWVCGGRFPPSRVHAIVSAIKSYFYGPFFAVNKSKQNYPTVLITKLYGLIQTNENLKGTTWRMMGVNVKYSEELCKIGDVFYPLHVVVSMDLEAATQLGGVDNSEVETPYKNFSNLEKTVSFEWF